MAHALRSPRLLPGERKAIADEMLEQQFQFRQNMALMHGLPMPAGPVRVTQPEEVPGDPVEQAVEVVEHVADAVTDAAEEPQKKSRFGKLAKAALVAALLGTGVSVPYVGDWIWGQEPVSVNQQANPSITSGDLLLELEKRGYAVAPTDLGEDIKRAFELRPELRNKLLEDVKRTLEVNGVRSSAIPSGAKS